MLKGTESGYKTSYQDDLCYKEYWGMRLELGSPSSWEQFGKTFKENFINHSGQLMQTISALPL